MGLRWRGRAARGNKWGDMLHGFRPTADELSQPKPLWIGLHGARSHPAPVPICSMTTKEGLHKLVDELSVQEAEAALVNRRASVQRSDVPRSGLCAN